MYTLVYGSNFLQSLALTLFLQLSFICFLFLFLFFFFMFSFVSYFLVSPFSMNLCFFPLPLFFVLFTKIWSGSHCRLVAEIRTLMCEAPVWGACVFLIIYFFLTLETGAYEWSLFSTNGQNNTKNTNKFPILNPFILYMSAGAVQSFSILCQ